MNTWTESARELLNDHLEKLRPNLAGSGADADEVTADLRRHVEQELGGVPVVTAEDVQRVLARISPPASLPDPPPASPPPVSRTRRALRWTAPITALVLGVILPFVTISFELVTHLCGGSLFDPVPSIGHAVLILLVPLCNLAALFASSHPRAPLSWIGLANGFAAGVALIYTLLFLPVLPLALVAVLLGGLGLLPLSPLLAFCYALYGRRKVRAAATARGIAAGRFGLGLLAGVAAMLGLEARHFLTRLGMELCVAASPASQVRGLHLLRAVGSEAVLLRSCYQRTSLVGDLVGVVFALRNPISTEQARVLYYRVTGRAFNAVPPPEHFKVGRAREDWVWDAEQGGLNVGQRLRHLALTTSRLDGSVDADAALGYLEWTLVFKNTDHLEHEARAQILLPPGAVVSRLTLWIDGEEREAAFGSRGTVRVAYQNVVHVRRDPVLVTTKGPDRVLVQCYPVPAQGEMKIRLGLTAPLTLPDADHALLRLPQLIEQNFGESASLRHAVWIEGKRRLTAGLPDLRSEPSGALFALRGEVPPGRLPDALITADRDHDAGAAWATHSARPNRRVVQSIMPASPVRAKALAVVVDGSRTMREAVPTIAAALEALPRSRPITLVLAGDEPLTCPASEAAAAAAWLRAQLFVGGQDNVPALTRGWDALAAAGGGELLWLHGPQPVELAPMELLGQKFSRRPGAVALREYPLVPGVNRTVESLDSFPDATAVPRGASLAGDLARELQRVEGEASLDVRRTMLDRDDSAAPVAPHQTSDHLARLWAADEVHRLLASPRPDRDSAVATAIEFHLVTPVTGAVVLETRQQYQAAGLEPVDAKSVPTVPEPETIALAAIAFLIFAWLVWHQRAPQGNR